MPWNYHFIRNIVSNSYGIRCLILTSYDMLLTSSDNAIINFAVECPDILDNWNTSSVILKNIAHLHREIYFDKMLYFYCNRGYVIVFSVRFLRYLKWYLYPAYISFINKLNIITFNILKLITLLWCQTSTCHFRNRRILFSILP